MPAVRLAMRICILSCRVRAEEVLAVVMSVRSAAGPAGDPGAGGQQLRDPGGMSAAELRGRGATAPPGGGLQRPSPGSSAGGTSVALDT